MVYQRASCISIDCFMREPNVIMAALWIASESDIDKAKLFACSKLKLDAFKAQQAQALESYLHGRDTFVCLPTGYGKSCIFQAAPLCWDCIHDVANNPDIPNALAVVVVPLKSLALNQLDRCHTMGLGNVSKTWSKMAAA